MKRNQVAKDVQNSVIPQTVAARQTNIERDFSRMKDELIARFGTFTLEINSAVLNTLIYSYYYDIYRTKKFHDMQKINESKKAAFMLKWLIHERPIYFDESSLDELDPKLMGILVCINEIFALRIAFMYAEIPMEIADDDMYSCMIYQLIYRAGDEGSWALIFDFLRKLYQGG